jgi:hypothetical protein
MRHRFAVAPLTLALLAAASAVPAAAASCKPESVAGLWVGHATTEVDLYCLIDVKKSGAVVQSSCFNPDTLKPEATLDGKVTLEKDCTVKATFQFKSAKETAPAKFRGKMTSNGQKMAGDFVIFGAQEAYRFIRQID